MPRFCTQCGAQNRDDAKFCKGCGVPLPPLPNEQAAPPPEVAAWSEAERRSQAAPAGESQGAPESVPGGKAFVYGGIASGVIALLVIGVGGLWWSSQQHESEPIQAGASAPETVSPPASTAAPVASAAQAAGKPAEELPQPAALQRPPPEAGNAKQAQPQTFAPQPAPARPAPPPHAQQSPQFAPPPAPSPTPAAVPAPAGPSRVGRVEALREALSACQHKGNFFTQQLCIQEVRWRYCGAPLDPNPLWGKIPECPNSAQQNNNP